MKKIVFVNFKTMQSSLLFAVALSAYLVERLEGDVLDVQALDGLEVDGEVAGVDGREVQPKRKTTTLTKLDFPGKQRRGHSPPTWTTVIGV